MDNNVKSKIHDFVFDFYLGDNLVTKKTNRFDLILQSVFAYVTKGSGVSMDWSTCEFAFYILGLEPTHERMSHVFGHDEIIDVDTFVAKVNRINSLENINSIGKVTVPQGFEGVVNEISLENTFRYEGDLAFLTANVHAIMESKASTSGSQKNPLTKPPSSQGEKITIQDMIESQGKGGMVSSRQLDQLKN